MSLIKNVRRKGAVVSIIGLLAAASSIYYSRYQTSHPLQAEQGYVAAKEPATAQKTKALPEIQSAPPTDPDEKYSSRDAWITSDWMTRVGKLTHEERSAYAGYDENTLIELAKNGDTKAIDVLTHLYVGRGIYSDNNLEKARKYAELGAVYGLVSTIPTMATLVITPPDFTKNDNSELFSDESKSHPKLIEAIALTQTIAMRGDPDLAEAMKKSYIGAYNTAYQTAVGLTPADEDAIKQRADDIYLSWQQERRELGLGDFDSAPASVKKYMEIISQKK